MKITFLGTGASDWDISLYAKGKYHRRYSSLLVDGDLLIDPGPNIFHFAKNEGRENILDGVKNIIVTHSHRDHFDSFSVARLCVDRDCTLWADRACRRKLKRDLGDETVRRIRFIQTLPGGEYDIGDYRITSLRSNHATPDKDEITRLYLVEKQGRILYYGCDSAWIPTVSWNVIKTKPVNLMVLECTCGELSEDDWRIFEHNTPAMLELMLKMFRKYSLFAPDVKYYASHIAMTLHKEPSEQIRLFESLGVTLAFDGTEAEV